MSLDRDLALEVLESGGDRAYVPVRLLDLDSFVRNYVEIYDKVNDNDRVKASCLTFRLLRTVASHAQSRKGCQTPLAAL